MEDFFLGNKKLQCLDSVYLPREDSYLLVETVKIKPYSSVLDIGCGTGIQGISMLLQGAKKCVFADTNILALQNASENVYSLGLEKKAELEESDLFDKINEKFDCIAFNAPYVVSEKIDDASTDGGKNGRMVLDRFLNAFPMFLHNTGACFFLQSSFNGIELTEEILEKKGMDFEIAARQKLFFEELVVFRCSTGRILKKKNT